MKLKNFYIIFNNILKEVSIPGTFLIIKLMVTNKEKELNAFALRLNQALDLAGYPPKGQGRQVALAKLMGVTQKGARNWLEGETWPTREKVIFLAKNLHVNYEWLASGLGSIQPKASPTQPEFEPTLEASEIIKQQIEAGIQRGLTPKDIAESVGVSEQTVSKWRQGRGVNVKNLPKLARVLGISLEQLLAGAPVQGRIPPYAYRLLREIEEKAAKGQLSKQDIETLSQVAGALAERKK